eukprot:8646551-Alexandrium_andersonii.AAC.1
MAAASQRTWAGMAASIWRAKVQGGFPGESGQGSGGVFGQGQEAVGERGPARAKLRGSRGS